MSIEPSLLDAIYDCAIDAAPWAQVLRGAMAAMGADSGGVLLARRGASDLLHWSSVGHSDVSVRLYTDYYMHLDPWSAIARREPPGHVIDTRRVFSDNYVACSEFFQDYLIPNGVRHVAGSRVYDDGEVYAMLGVQRVPGRPAFSEDDDRALAALLPHLAAAAGLWRRLQGNATAASPLAWPLPVWWLRGDAGLVEANPAGRRMMARGGAIRLRGGALEVAAADWPKPVGTVASFGPPVWLPLPDGVLLFTPAAGPLRGGPAAKVAAVLLSGSA